MQVWDVNNNKAPKWTARNLPNDELDLKIPVWDTDLAFLSRSNSHSLVACTAYSEIREYDTRGPRKPVIAAELFGTKEGRDRYQIGSQFLSRVLQSRQNENHIYAVTHEGHPLVLDRRQGYKVVKKMPGAKGSVRDAILA